MSATGTPQPQRVIAQYLTVGGTTVDITPGMTTQPNAQPHELVATCTGCQQARTVSTYRTEYTGEHPYGNDVDCPERAETDARDWAQDHATTCRAIPKPEVGR